MKRALVKLVIVAALLLFAAVALFFASPVVVTVSNQSGDILTSITVEIQGQNRHLVFPDLATGSSSQKWFLNTGADAHYTFKAIRPDGTRLSAEGGYLTSGSFYGSADFQVGPDGSVIFREEYH